VGVDVAAAGQCLADECVCFVVGAGVAGVDADGPARAVVVLNAAIRMVWVMSLVWVSRTCWPGPPGPVEAGRGLGGGLLGRCPGLLLRRVGPR
jgi:hypothetical protein